MQLELPGRENTYRNWSDFVPEFMHIWRTFCACPATDARWPVSRVLCSGRQTWRPGDGHSSRAPITRRLMRSTRTTDRRRSRFAAFRPYPTLLPAGLAVPLPLPETRWALTPPFHPCPRRGRSVLCGAFPKVPSPKGDPSPGVTRRRASEEPGLSSRQQSARGHPAT